MRQGSNNGRRPRGRTNRKQHGGGPSRPHTFDSNGPDGRVRGNARQVYEKYLTLARDAQSAGDRIAAEAYFQHAEHYYRIMSDSTDPQRAERRQEERQPAPAHEVEAAGDDAAVIQVNGEAGMAAPTPRAESEAAGERGNGLAAEHEEAAPRDRTTEGAQEINQDGGRKAAPAKRRGRPRKPRANEQENLAAGDGDGTSAESAAAEPTSPESAASES